MAVNGGVGFVSKKLRLLPAALNASCSRLALSGACTPPIPPSHSTLLFPPCTLPPPLFLSQLPIGFPCVSGPMGKCSYQLVSSLHCTPISTWRQGSLCFSLLVSLFHPSKRSEQDCLGSCLARVSSHTGRASPSSPSPPERLGADDAQPVMRKPVGQGLRRMWRKRRMWVDSFQREETPPVLPKRREEEEWWKRKKMVW